MCALLFGLQLLSDPEAFMGPAKPLTLGRDLSTPC